MAEIIFEHQPDSVVTIFISRLSTNREAVLTVCRIQTASGEKLGLKIFRFLKTQRFIPLIDCLQSEDLAEMCESGPFQTILYDFFSNAHPDTCTHLLKNLPAEIIDKLCQEVLPSRYPPRNHLTVMHVILDRFFLSALKVNVLNPAILSTCEEVEPFFETYLETNHFYPCEMLINRIGTKVVVEKVAFLPGRIQSNHRLSPEEKEVLIKQLKFYEILKDPDPYVRKGQFDKDQFFSFLNMRIYSIQGADEVDYFIEFMEKAIQACPQRDRETALVLRGLLCELYLDVENQASELGERTEITYDEKGKELKRGEEIKVIKEMQKEQSHSFYRKKRHHTLLQITQSDWRNYKGHLTELHDSRLGNDFLSHLTQNYWDANEENFPLDYTPAFLDIVAGSLDIHDAYSKGLYFKEQPNIEEKKSQSQPIQQPTIKELKARSDRLQALGWHIFSQKLADYLENSVISKKSNHRFLRPLLILKFKIEIAVGKEDWEQAIKRMEKIINHLNKAIELAKEKSLFSQMRMLQALHKQVTEIHRAAPKRQKLSAPRLESKKTLSFAISRFSSSSEPSSTEMALLNSKRELGTSADSEDLEDKEPLVCFLVPTSDSDLEIKQAEGDIESSSENSDNELVDQKSYFNSTQSLSNRMGSFRTDFLDIKKISNGLNQQERSLSLELKDKILELDSRVNGCCMSSDSIQISREKLIVLLKLHGLLKTVLVAIHLGNLTSQQLNGLHIGIQQCSEHRAVDTFCYRFKTSSSSLFSSRKNTGTRQLIQKVNTVFQERLSRRYI